MATALQSLVRQVPGTAVQGPLGLSQSWTKSGAQERGLPRKSFGSGFGSRRILKASCSVEERTAESWGQAAFGVCTAVALILGSPNAASAQVKLPPLSNDPARCERAFTGNTIGQANGVADKVLDLRACDFSNDKKNLKGKTLSSALMVDAKFDGADLSEVIMSKAYAVGASFKGTDFTSAVVDRVAFDGSDMQGANFYNTVLSGSTFVGTNLKGASFEDALIGYVDIQKLCRNTTLEEEAYLSLGCPRK